MTKLSKDVHMRELRRLLESAGGGRGNENVVVFSEVPKLLKMVDQCALMIERNKPGACAEFENLSDHLQGFNHPCITGWYKALGIVADLAAKRQWKSAASALRAIGKGLAHEFEVHAGELCSFAPGSESFHAGTFKPAISGISEKIVALIEANRCALWDNSVIPKEQQMPDDAEDITLQSGMAMAILRMLPTRYRSVGEALICDARILLESGKCPAAEAEERARHPGIRIDDEDEGGLPTTVH